MTWISLLTNIIVCAKICIMKIKLGTKLKCLRCGWEWIPRKADVKQCPNRKCHSIYWDTPKEKEGENQCK